MNEPIKVWMGVCKHYGPSIHNVAEKYREYAPEERIEWVEDWLDADLCIDHLIGTPDRLNLVHPGEREFSEDVKARLEMAKAVVLRVAYIMHCAIVNDKFYVEALDESVVSTGFLDIAKYIDDRDYRWLRVAWGVDPAEFLLPARSANPKYLIYTWGASADPEEEYIKTIYNAVKRAGGKMLHSGLDYRFDSGEHYEFVPPASSKAEIAQRYNQCWYANAMRKEDGFELANIEAPLSNCLPITLDRGCYKHFFEGTSAMVREEILEDDLTEMFIAKGNVHPHWPSLKREILERFNWRDAVEPFWERILKSC